MGKDENSEPMQRRRAPRAIQLLCVAADTDRALLAHWENHLRPLEQAGHLTVWSERHLQAGTDRRKEFSAHLKKADCVVFLLSADFFANTTCLSLMHDALLHQHQEPLRLIPLLVRPVAWQVSELGTLTPLPADGRAVLTWEHPDEGWRQAVGGLGRLLGLPLHGQLISQRTGTDRDHMLRRLRVRYDQILAQTLQDAVRVELGLASRPAAIESAASLALRLPALPNQALPPQTSIVDVYEQARQELLILGEPGAGKSTLLLELAHRLLHQAEQDETQPLPFVVPLSSWANRQLPFQEWLIEQVRELYDVPQRLSHQWVEAEQVLPLLDGLDEMEEEARPACIQAINAYHRDHLHPLVVCSRTNEYERATTQERLALHTAVVVQPLSPEQVETHLVSLDKPLAALRSALKRNATLAALATTPLLLQVLILTYQGSAYLNVKSVRYAKQDVSLIYSLGFIGGLRRRFRRLESMLSCGILHGERLIMNANLALQANLPA